MDKLGQAQDEYSVPFLENETYSVPFLEGGTSEKHQIVSEEPHITAPQTSGSSFEAVKQMQQAILNFGAALSTHPVMSMKDQGAKERSRTTGEKDYLGGTDPFGKFLTNQYINNPGVVGGKQFINIDLGEPARSGTAIPNVNLKGVINTIMRVGTPGAEHKVDGIWQTRTNNALKQIYAVAASLFQFAKDVNIKISGFTEEQLNNFKKLIPESYTQINTDKAELAQELTKYIVAFTDLYKKFENAVLENAALKEMITQDKPVSDHSKNYKTELSADENSFYEANKDAVIPGAVINGKPVKLMDVANMTAFTKFLQSVNMDTSKPDVVKKQLSLIKDLVETGGAGF